MTSELAAAKAEVVRLRTQFPRIMVQYFATEDDVTTPISLPEMRTATAVVNGSHVDGVDAGS